MTSTIYALPALLSLFTKIGICIYDRLVKVRNVQTRLFLAFLISFAIQNVVEATAFITYADNIARIPDLVGRAWYSATMLVIALLFHLAFLVATKKAQGRHTFRSAIFLLYIPVVVLQGLLWSSSLLIVSFEPMGYSITKIPGPLFFLWELYALGYFAGTVALLIYGAYTQITAHRKLQNKLFLLGIAPLVLLLLGIIALQRLIGFRAFTAAATLPFTSTLFAIVAAYAIYHYRLLDVAFYVPWSKVRKRKTELYKRIQAVAADIGKLDSPRDILERIANALRCRVTLLGGPQPWVAAPDDHAATGESRLSPAFPREALTKIDRIVTLDEAADCDPELHDLMKRYGVGAIVPFSSHPMFAGYSLLLDQQFNSEIYSSLDFKIVDRLFSVMAQRFFEDYFLIRSEIVEVNNQLRDATRRLMHARRNVVGVDRKLSAAKKLNRSLREEVVRLRRESFKVVSRPKTSALTWGEKTLYQYLAEREKEALVAALQRCAGNKTEAARLLGVPLHTLNQLVERYGVDKDEPRNQ